MCVEDSVCVGNVCVEGSVWVMCVWRVVCVGVMCGGGR